MKKRDSKTFTFTRVFNVPRKTVFNAWVDEIEFAKWWGPDGFTNPLCSLDVRPRGAIRVDMKAPDGEVYRMGGSFIEINPDELLVFTSTALNTENDEPFLEVLNTITFEDYEGHTKIELNAEILKLTGEGEESVEGMEEGWNQSLARLDDLLAVNIS